MALSIVRPLEVVAKVLRLLVVVLIKPVVGVPPTPAVPPNVLSSRI